MATTTAQIIEDAAWILGEQGEGQVLESWVNGDLTRAVNEVFEELRNLNITTWARASDVPDEYAGHFAMLVADQRKTKYQIPDARYARIMAEGWGQNIDGMAVKAIKRMQSKGKLGYTEIESM